MIPIEHLNFVAVLLTFFALVHLCWPARIKLLVDRLAEEIGTHRFESNYDEAYYFAVGRVYAYAAGVSILAIAMTFLLG